MTKSRDDDLRGLLHAWQPAAPPPEALRRSVWQRIGSVPEPVVLSWLQRACSRIGRPAFASAVVAGALVLGLTLGAGASHSAQLKGYVRSLDPYAHRR